MGSLVPPLRKLQRNDIIKAIEAIGLDPVEFLLEKHEILGKPSTWIKHISSESRFTIKEQLGVYSGDYVTGDGRLGHTSSLAGRV